jgi:hypothetical protein
MDRYLCSDDRAGDLIYMEQWLDFHPYKRPVQSDYYYLKLLSQYKTHYHGS